MFWHPRHADEPWHWAKQTIPSGHTTVCSSSLWWIYLWACKTWAKLHPQWRPVISSSILWLRILRENLPNMVQSFPYLDCILPFCLLYRLKKRDKSLFHASQETKMAMHSQNMGITGPYLSVFGRFSRSSTSGCLFQILLKKAIRLGRKPCTIYCSARINLRQSNLWGGGGRWFTGRKHEWGRGWCFLPIKIHKLWTSDITIKILDMPVLANLETPRKHIPEKRPAAHPQGHFFASQKIGFDVVKINPGSAPDSYCRNVLGSFNIYFCSK